VGAALYSFKMQIYHGTSTGPVASADLSVFTCTLCHISRASERILSFSSLSSVGLVTEKRERKKI